MIFPNCRILEDGSLLFDKNPPEQIKNYRRDIHDPNKFIADFRPCLLRQTVSRRKKCGNYVVIWRCSPFGMVSVPFCKECTLCVTPNMSETGT